MDNPNLENETLSIESAKKTIEIFKGLNSDLVSEKDALQAEVFRLEAEIVTMREEYKIRLAETEKKYSTCSLELQAIRNMMPDMKAYKDAESKLSGEEIKPLDSIILED